MKPDTPTTERRGSGPHIAVIGGGIAGLAAAVELVDAGAQVTVLDADRLGGKLRTSTFAGRPVDRGPDAMLARVPDAVDLARRVGLGNQLAAPATGRAFVCLDGDLVPLPALHVLGVPGDPDADDVARILGTDGLTALRHDLADPGGPPLAEADETIGAFIRRRLGDAVADRLVGPLIGGINAGNIDSLSLAATAPQIDALARSADEASLVRAAAAVRATATATATGPVFLTPTGGMATFVDALRAHLVSQGTHLLEHCAVRGLERLPTTWRVIADDATSRGVTTEVTVEVDGIVVATPAGAGAGIVQDHAPEAAEHLGAIRYASVALATFAFRPDTVGRPLDGSGFLVPRSEALLCTAASWSSTKWHHLAPHHGDGSVLIRASAGRSDDRRITTLDDTALLATLIDDLTPIMALTDAPTQSRLDRWPASLPQYAPGHLQRIAAIEADLARHAPTIAVAGSALRGVGIPASIRSGRHAAETVMVSVTRGDHR